ncbi:MAG: NAD(P)/FAD-dependent oxidoreductase [bacterium]|nr:NAD(P)/FAD-dependent oxidoreductase [bacterium]
MKKILILGGGFGGVATYKHLHKIIHPANIHNIQVELINKTNYFTFSPMLHEVATGSVGREHIVQPLREMLKCCGKDFHQALIIKIDPKKKLVYTNTGNYSYDILVIALGVEQSYFNTPGAEKYALALKWLPGAIAIRNRIINSFEQASEKHDTKDSDAMNKFLNFVIVGGGPTGTELAGQLSDLLQNEMVKFYGDIPINHAKVVLIHAGRRLIEQLSTQASASALKRLQKMGVEVILGETVTEVTKDSVKCSSGSSIPSNSVFWTAGTESGLKKILPTKLLNERGMISVSGTFQVPEYPEIFALGDNAYVTEDDFKYPPLAQAAVQASSTVAKNIIAHIHHQTPRKKRYRHKGDIIPIGNSYGIFEQKTIRFTGFFAWVLRRIVFMQTMYGWRNKIHVLFDWTVETFSPRDTSEF